MSLFIYFFQISQGQKPQVLHGAWELCPNLTVKAQEQALTEYLLYETPSKHKARGPWLCEPLSVGCTVETWAPPPSARSPRLSCQVVSWQVVGRGWQHRG